RGAEAPAQRTTVLELRFAAGDSGEDRAGEAPGGEAGGGGGENSAPPSQSLNPPRARPTLGSAGKGRSSWPFGAPPSNVPPRRIDRARARPSRAVPAARTAVSLWLSSIPGCGDSTSVATVPQRKA